MIYNRAGCLAFAGNAIDMTELRFPIPWSPSWTAEVADLAHDWQGGDSVGAGQISRALASWRQRLQMPSFLDEERFDVVDENGNALGYSAPRWFCHLTGLRHRVVHILLRSPQGMLVLQMRSPEKSQWPMRLDTTVGGHLKAGQSWEEGVQAELYEEIGLAADDQISWLHEPPLQSIGNTYVRNAVDEGEPPLRNQQVNRLYTGTITSHGLAAIDFRDGEVAGIYLCRPQEVKRMIELDFLIAPGLRHAFPHWWRWYQTSEGRQT